MRTLEPKKVTELAGVPLDCWVAKAMRPPAGHEFMVGIFEQRISLRNIETGDEVPWSPSTDWGQGGPIIERECIDIEFTDKPHKRPACCATINSPDDGAGVGYGATPLIAAMRAFVMATFGSEVRG